VRMELNSERPGTGNDENNMTLTNYSMKTVDVEELRQELAQASIELEE